MPLSSSLKKIAFISTRSMMPMNLSSAPIGSWRSAGRVARRSFIICDDVEEVRAGAVHLVDEGDARDAVLVGLAPDRLGLRLDAADGAEDRDRAVEHAQRALDLDGEVDVAGRVDDLDAVVLPVARGRGGGDRDAALLLLDHPVHGRRALVDLADLVRLARVEQDALGRRRLAGVDVGHDADVARLIEWVLLSHLISYLDLRRSSVACCYQR